MLAQRVSLSAGNAEHGIKDRIAEIKEAPRGKTQIIISELPYQVNKAKLVQKIAELVKDKKLKGISDLRDEL